jgi:hypothetical protein
VKGLHNQVSLEAMAKLIAGARIYYLQNYSGNEPLAGANFKGKPFTAGELEKLKKIASQQVQVCQVR